MHVTPSPVFQVNEDNAVVNTWCPVSVSIPLAHHLAVSQIPQPAGADNGICVTGVWCYLFKSNSTRESRGHRVRLRL